MKYLIKRNGTGTKTISGYILIAKIKKIPQKSKEKIQTAHIFL